MNPEKVYFHSLHHNSDSSHSGVCLKTWIRIPLLEILSEGILPIPHPTGTRTSGRPGSSVETLEKTLVDFKAWLMLAASTRFVSKVTSNHQTRPFVGVLFFAKFFNYTDVDWCRKRGTLRSFQKVCLPWGETHVEYIRSKRSSRFNVSSFLCDCPCIKYNRGFTVLTPL